MSSLAENDFSSCCSFNDSCLRPHADDVVLLVVLMGVDKYPGAFAKMLGTVPGCR